MTVIGFAGLGLALSLLVIVVSAHIDPHKDLWPQLTQSLVSVERGFAN